MKKSVVFILWAFGASTCLGQKIRIAPVLNKDLKAVLCNIDTVLFRRGAMTSAMLYKVSNPSGSAHMPGTDEITNKFFIAVTNGDEEPDQILYNVGDFLGPRILRFKALPHDKYFLAIEYGEYKHRKRINLDISLGKVSEIK
jgi:hypothetical protein